MTFENNLQIYHNKCLQLSKTTPYFSKKITLKNSETPLF